VSSFIHRAIIVTCDEQFVCAKDLLGVVESFGLQHAGIAFSPINRFSTFTVCPSGSKAGWQEDVEHLQKLEMFKNYLIQQFTSEDGGSHVKFAHVTYGECIPSVEQHPYGKTNQYS
jgi:hypothetical protein